MARIKIGNVKYKPAVGMHHIQFSGEPTPASIWAGTTWEIDTDYQGITIIGSGGDYVLGATGGGTSHNHEGGSLATLIVNNPSNEKNLLFKTTTTSEPWTSNFNMDIVSGGGAALGGLTNGVQISGTTGAASSMPPFKVVNYWKRTA